MNSTKTQTTSAKGKKCKTLDKAISDLQTGGCRFQKQAQS